MRGNELASGEQWGNDIARALEDLGAAAADPDSGMQAWARHDRQLTTVAEQARWAAQHAEHQAASAAS